jgi:tetratricopeptide (TPR) repeat protein
MFQMSIAASALSLWTQGLQLATAADPQWVRTWPQRLAAAGDAVWFYLGKVLWPDPLMTIYPRWQIDAGSWVSYLPLLAVILLFSFLWLNCRSGGAGSRACFFAFAYFLTVLLPVLGLIDTFIFRYSLVFDHFNYLPSMGPLALAGAGLARAAELVLPKRPRLQSVLCTGLLLILGSVSWERTRVYNSQETLWTDTLAKNPDCWLAHNGLGLAFLEKGKADEALEKFQKALEINPNYPEAHTNLGFAFFQKGEADEAIQQFQKALESNPNNAEAHTNLGNAFFRTGQLSEAIEQYEMAVKINPKFAQAHSNLGAVFSQKGELDEAIAQYHEALEINPNLAEAHMNLGNALFRKGQLSEAIEQFEIAVKINPKFAQAHASLGTAFVQKGQLDDAITEFQEALRLNPNLGSAKESLAKALESKK